jgi:hypothetical protein
MTTRAHVPTLTFDEVWARVHSLEGRTVPLAAHGEIDVLKVDAEGLVRRTSRGRVGRMSIDSFRWTFENLIERRQMDRLEILAGIKRWESSGVVAVLAATGFFVITRRRRVGLATIET